MMNVELVAMKHVVFFDRGRWGVATGPVEAPPVPGAIELASLVEARRIAERLNGAGASQAAAR